MSTPAFRAMLGLTVLLASAACAPDAARTDLPLESGSFDGIRIDEARAMPPSGPFVEGRPGPNGTTVLDPSSAPLQRAIPYLFSLGHCGLLSPVDVDGSFWDPIDGVTPEGQPLHLEGDSEMINATAGVIVIIDDEARFRTQTGSVIRFSRHDGAKEFPGCI